MKLIKDSQYQDALDQRGNTAGKALGVAAEIGQQAPLAYFAGRGAGALVNANKAYKIHRLAAGIRTAATGERAAELAAEGRAISQTVGSATGSARTVGALSAAGYEAGYQKLTAESQNIDAEYDFFNIALS